MAFFGDYYPHSHFRGLVKRHRRQEGVAGKQQHGKYVDTHTPATLATAPHPSNSIIPIRGLRAGSNRSLDIATTRTGSKEASQRAGITVAGNRGITHSARRRRPQHLCCIRTEEEERAESKQPKEGRQNETVTRAKITTRGGGGGRRRPLIWQQGALTRVEKHFLPFLLQTFWGQVFLPAREVRVKEGRKYFYYFAAARLEL